MILKPLAPSPLARGDGTQNVYFVLTAVPLGAGEARSGGVRLGTDLLAALQARLAAERPDLGELNASEALRAAALLALGEPSAPEPSCWAGYERRLEHVFGTPLPDS